MIDSIRNPQIQIRDRVGWIITSCILLSLAIAARVGMIAWPFLNDSGLYAYMGKMVTQGGTLYVDFYENKLPGAALICSAFWRAFGAWWPGYVLGQLAMALAGAGLLGRAVHRSGRAESGLATFLYAAVFLNFCWAVFTGFQLEPIQAFFEILAAAAAVEALAERELTPLLGDAFVVGLAAGAAAMLKPSGLAVAVAFASVLAMRRCEARRWTAAMASMLAGIAVPTAITAIYVWRTGIWRYLPEVWRQIQLYAQATPFDWFMGVKLIIVGMLLGFPLVVRMVPFRRGRENRPAEAGRPLVWFAIAWFALDLVGVIAQRRMYLYHFYPLIPAAALLYGMLPRPPRVAQVLVGLLPIAIWSMLWHGTDLRQLSRGLKPDAISRYVAAHTHAGDAVFADQIGGLLIETDREPGSRYGTFFYYINYDTAPLDYCRGILADFERRRPVYVVLGANEAAARGQPSHEPEMALCAARRDNFVRAGRRFDAYLKQHYTLETHIDGSDVYRRRDDAADQGATAAIGE